ncbi:hypothetical protein FACS1894216_22410 [Synergistales bacterium]|nr:hypothetical protein FACS1894216_22410 [Synergistales bacterium]
MNEIRICGNCHHHNGISLLECEECGLDLSMVIPVDEDDIPQKEPDPIPAPATSPCAHRWGIAIGEGASNITVIEDRLKVGRENSPLAQHLNKSKFISRNHAQLFVTDGKLYVLDASTNGTYVNNTRIQKLESAVLNDCDEVRFADVSFKVVCMGAD